MVFIALMFTFKFMQLAKDLLSNLIIQPTPWLTVRLNNGFKRRASVKKYNIYQGFKHSYNLLVSYFLY